MSDDPIPVFAVESSDNPDFDFIVYETPEQVLGAIQTSLEYLDDQIDETLTIVIKRVRMSSEQIANFLEEV